MDGGYLRLIVRCAICGRITDGDFTATPVAAIPATGQGFDMWRILTSRDVQRPSCVDRRSFSHRLRISSHSVCFFCGSFFATIRPTTAVG